MGNPDNFPEQFIGVYRREQSPDRFLFVRGEVLSISHMPPLFEFDVSASKLAVFDVLPNSSMIPLVSENVARLLTENWSTDIQLIDAHVVAKGQSLNGYKLLNITHLVKCVDYSRSEFISIPNTTRVMKFNRLRLKSDGMASHNLAREADYASYLYVTEQVKAAFAAKQWRGYQFSPQESVHP